jgi:hypothetical protein
MPEITYKGLERSLKPVVETNIEYIKIDEEILIRPIDKDHVQNLITNIKECGQITPVIVEEYKDGLFRVVAHAHEFSALKRIYEELKKEKKSTRLNILTRRFMGDEIQRVKVQVSENVMHKPMTMEEVAIVVTDLMRKDKKLSQAEIGRQLGWSPSYICRCLKWLEENYDDGSDAPSMTEDVTLHMQCETHDNTETQINGDREPIPQDLSVVGSGEDNPQIEAPESLVGQTEDKPPSQPETPKKDEKPDEEVKEEKYTPKQWKKIVKDWNGIFKVKKLPPLTSFENGGIEFGGKNALNNSLEIALRIGKAMSRTKLIDDVIREFESVKRNLNGS